MKVDLINYQGEKTSQVSLPDFIFGVRPNQDILAQAVRVYQSRLRQGTASTKTRGEVVGSGRKIWRQKGTGRARHGDRYAPIFVGGGRAHGPKPRSWSIAFPKKMRHRALVSALSQKVSQGKLVVVKELKLAKAKTREMTAFLGAVVPDPNGLILLVTTGLEEKAFLASRNLAKVELIPADQLNVLAALKADWIIICQDAIERLTARLEGDIRPAVLSPPKKTAVVLLQDLSLSQRVVASLKRAGITTLAELEEKTQEELVKIKGIGPKALNEIREKLNQR